MVLGFTKWCRSNFLPKSGNQISLTSQSSAERGFYVPHPSTGLPPVSCLQLGKNLVPQRKANKSFSSPTGWNPETWDLVTVFHFQRVRNAPKPVEIFLFSLRREWMRPHTKWFLSVAGLKHQCPLDRHVGFASIAWRYLGLLWMLREEGSHLPDPPERHKYSKPYFRPASARSLWDVRF